MKYLEVIIELGCLYENDKLPMLMFLDLSLHANQNILFHYTFVDKNLDLESQINFLI